MLGVGTLSNKGEWGCQMEWFRGVLRVADLGEALEIFNLYIVNAFAGCGEVPASLGTIRRMVAECGNLPAVAVRDHEGALAGFGLLRPYSPLPAFSHAVMITVFISPKHTRQGIGARMLSYMEEAARRCGVTTVLAHISSRNEPSLAFHRKQGFMEAGRFRDIGSKCGSLFDVVWMQKSIEEPCDSRPCA